MGWGNSYLPKCFRQWGPSSKALRVQGRRFRQGLLCLPLEAAAFSACHATTFTSQYRPELPHLRLTGCRMG